MIRSVAVALLALALAGCSGSSQDQSNGQGPGKEAVLVEVGGLLRAAGGEARGPQKPADLAKFEHGYPLGYAAVKSGDVVVIWGAKPADEGDVAAGKGGKAVVAYEKQTPAEGGWVLLQDGTTKQMTADEFKAAPKAK